MRMCMVKHIHTLIENYSAIFAVLLKWVDLFAQAINDYLHLQMDCIKECMFYHNYFKGTHDMIYLNK